MKQIVTLADFCNLTESSEYVLVDFWASWCGPCRMLTETLKVIEHCDYENLIIACIDIEDADPELLEQFNIRSVPTLYFFKKGENLWKSFGAIGVDDLKAKIEGSLD